jgi:hypothetical protein
MQQLTNRAEILSQTGIKVGNTMIYGTYSSKAFSDALAGADTTVAHLGQQVEQVTMGATHLAQKFGMTVPQAMAAAGQAGVNLTQKVMNQKGQLTALGDQVWNTIAGYEAMGQTSGNVGHDI